MKVKELQETIKNDSESLLNLVKKPFEKFVDGDIVAEQTIKVKRARWDGKLHGAYITETISMREKYNSLCGLSIQRVFYLDAETNEREGACESYNIHLYWFDCDDHLEYSKEYYPNMSNEILYNKVNKLLKTGAALAKTDWSFRNHEEE